MKKGIVWVLLLALVAGTLVSCKEDGPNESGEIASQPETSQKETESAKDAESDFVEVDGDFTITTDVTSGFSVQGTTYTITKEGEYVLTGELSDGQVVVDAPEDVKVTLVLNGVYISCSTKAPIYIKEADKVVVKAQEGSFNQVVETRAARTASNTDEEDETNGNAAIYALCDMNISGKGSLVVKATYNNGIQTKDDLEVKNVTLKVTAPNNALKGNDSVTIESGNLILISTGGDGIATSNSDISSKGNQRGTISILGGVININASQDGIDAAYDIVIENEPSITICTGKYADLSGQASPIKTTDFYLIIPTSLYSNSQRYVAYYYNDDFDNGYWAESTFETYVYSSNGRSQTQYYGNVLQAPNGYANVAFFIFETSTNSTTKYVAMTDRGTNNTSQNGYMFSSVSGSKISGSWVTVSMSSGGGTGKSAESAKGLKADNEIVINGGVFDITAQDDAIHANDDVTLENEESPKGDITINGGSITLASDDDGIHADNNVTINTGTINITTSYEGIEGAVITVNDGTVYVYATDDGLNGTTGASTGFGGGGMGGPGGMGGGWGGQGGSTDTSNYAYVYINGGYVQVQTASGDTDAIDVNGNYVQTGGFVLVLGGSSSGQVSGSVDVDGTVKVTGGTILAFGGICETPTTGSCNYVTMSRKSFTSGEYTLVRGTETIASFKVPGNFSGLWICSDNLTKSATFTLNKDGSKVASWTQSSSSQTAN